jgi:hypothetical protein
VTRCFFRLSLIVSLWLGVAAHAETLQFSSGAGNKLLIELYTSEGCSSCPQAERFLNRLGEHPDLWRTYVPVAFHVDYWDRLGWRDRFSRAAYSQRQRRYAELGYLSSVYTPGFLVNGREWRRGWFQSDPPPAQEGTGELLLTLEDDRVSADYTGVSGRYRLYLALLGMGLGSEIDAGENRGRRARHDFVVLGFVTADSADGRWRLPMPKPGERGADGYALAAWVGRGGDPTPLQVVGGPLPEDGLSSDPLRP